MKPSSTPSVPPGSPIDLVPRAGLEDPLVQPFAADAERVLEALVGTGDVAVERHGQAWTRSWDIGASSWARLVDNGLVDDGSPERRSRHHDLDVAQAEIVR